MAWDWSPSATCLRLELRMLIPAFGLYPCGADLRSVCAAVRRSHPTGISQAACGGLAEGVGFEPTVGLTQRSISSRVP